MSEELQRCPFCGSAAEQWKHHLSEGGYICPVFHVGCRNDKCTVRPATHIRGQWEYPQRDDLTDEQAQAKAIAGWNRRV